MIQGWDDTFDGLAIFHLLLRSRITGILRIIPHGTSPFRIWEIIFTINENHLWQSMAHLPIFPCLLMWRLPPEHAGAKHKSRSWSCPESLLQILAFLVNFPFLVPILSSITGGLLKITPARNHSSWDHFGLPFYDLQNPPWCFIIHFCRALAAEKHLPQSEHQPWAVPQCGPGQCRVLVQMLGEINVWGRWNRIDMMKLNENDVFLDLSSSMFHW